MRKSPARRTSANSCRTCESKFRPQRRRYGAARVAMSRVELTRAPCLRIFAVTPLRALSIQSVYLGIVTLLVVRPNRRPMSRCASPESVAAPACTMNNANTNFISGLQEAVRENPVSAALIGMGVLWMFTGGSKITAAAALLGPAAREAASGAGAGLQASTNAAKTVGGGIMSSAGHVADNLGDHVGRRREDRPNCRRRL